MADLDELERLLAAATAVGASDGDKRDSLYALVCAAPALIAAARRWDAVRGEPYVELWEAAEEDRAAARAEVERLRALCREVAESVDGLIDAHVCTGVDACACKSVREATVARLRAAGGGT